MSQVLVVDDDPDIRTLLQIALERDGHSVEVAEGGTDGLAALRAWGKGRPVVILDVQMPDLDGWQVLATIREDATLRDLPVILCTVRAGAADLTRGWLAGCDAYLPKPFDIAHMSTEVATLAGTPERRAEAPARRTPARAPRVAPLVDDLRADPAAWLPALTLVATDATGQVVGPVVCSRAWVGDASRPLADHDPSTTGTFRYAPAFG